jgi:hypothetical protein
MITNDPLGDVVMGELTAGDTATAVCFVADAQTNTGAQGSAVRIESGGLSGYAAVADLPQDPADRMTFDRDEDDLRERLPSCSA